MRLTTNYSTKDWQRLIGTFTIMLVITAIPVIAFTQLIFIPILSEWVIFLTFINENEIVDDYVQHTVKHFIENKLPESVDMDNVYDTIEKIDNKSETVLALWMIVLTAPLLIPIWIMFKIIDVSVYFSKHVCIRLDTVSRMSLVIFNNGKRVYSSVKKSKPNKDYKK